MRPAIHFLRSAGVVLAIVAAGVLAAPATAAVTKRISVSTSSAQANDFSETAAVSASGRFVAFYSGASNLVPGDTNGVEDVFVRDRDPDRDGILDEPGAVRTRRLSLSSGGAQANGESFDAAVSASGRFVVFDSEATNLVPGDTNGFSDVFVRDRDTDRDGRFDEPGAVRTRRLSLSSGGAEANNSSFYPALSASGRFVAFSSSATNLVPGDANAQSDVFVRDRDTDRDGVFDEPGAVRTRRLSLSSEGTQAEGFSVGPSVSASGRFVAFSSAANNLVPGDTNGAVYDVFVRDRDADRDGVFDEPGAVATSRLSVSSADAQANNASLNPAVSASGRFVAFWSNASNLVTGDTNGAFDVFVRDRDTDRDGRFDEPGAVATTRLSVSSADGQANGGSEPPAVSASGRFVVFSSLASNLVAGDTNGVGDVFVRDRDTDRDGLFDEPGAVTTSRLSVSSGGGEANEFSGGAAVSANGRSVVFESDATNLVSPDTNAVTDIFVRSPLPDPAAAVITTRTSVSTSLAQANNGSDESAVSASGRFVAFSSGASNLVPGDANATFDVFVRDRDTDRDGRFDEPESTRTRRLSLSSAGGEGNGGSLEPAVSASGRFVAFESGASNLVPGDSNTVDDVFVRDRDPDRDGRFDEAGAVRTMRLSLSSGGDEANSDSVDPAVSASGRFVAFYSGASNLVPGDTNGDYDVFVRDRDPDRDGVFDEAGAVRTRRLSVDSGGGEANGNSEFPAVSASGRFVVFSSGASNLVPGDTNGATDVFVRDRDTDRDGVFDEPGAVRTTRVSVDGGEANSTSFDPALSASGRFVVFSSIASNLVPGDTNGFSDVFVRGPFPLG